MSSTEMKEYRGRSVFCCCQKAYVANVDRTKGITILDLDDNELLCLNKKTMLEFLINCVERNRVYHELFTRIINYIDSHLNIPAISYNIYGKLWFDDYSYYCNVTKCAFK